MRRLPELALLTLSALGVVASCSQASEPENSASVGGAAGELAAGRAGAGPESGGNSVAKGGSSRGGSGGRASSGRGGGTAASSGRGGAAGELAMGGDDAGSEAGGTSVAKGGSSRGGSGGRASSGRGGAAATSGGKGSTDNPGGMDATGGEAASSAGMASAGGEAGMGGSAGDGSIPWPGHAATICDPNASYSSPFPAAGPTATRLSEAYFFTEGPVWIASGGYLLFVDMYNASAPPYVPGAHIRRFTPPSTFDTFIPDADSNGLALSTDGLTLFAARRIKTNSNDGEIASYDLSTQAKATVLDSPVDPNDLATRSDRNLYFSDGDVFRLDPAGQLSTAAHVDSQSANGVTLAPDESRLYSGWSDGNVYASALDSEGDPSAAAPFATLQDGGHPDGMAVDCAGNLYVADYANGIVQVFDRDGAYLDRITLPAASSPAAEHATNVAFGGADHRTLFITGHRGDWSDPAVGELHSITLNVPGLPY